jgi:hypothetical protein
VAASIGPGPEPARSRPETGSSYHILQDDLSRPPRRGEVDDALVAGTGPGAGAVGARGGEGAVDQDIDLVEDGGDGRPPATRRRRS